MKKQDRVKRVIDALQVSGKDWSILDGSIDEPRHIRVKGVCDLWPSSGTYKVGSKWHKKDYDGLLSLLGSGMAMDKPVSRYEALEKRLSDLEQYVSHLDFELGALRNGASL